ncbi:MAG: amino acid adenylation domain-containing protein [Myxococcales bacterium]
MKRLEAVLTSACATEAELIAVEWGEEKLSYRALDELANRFAHCLLAAGVRSGDRVGLHVPRSGRCIAAMLACLRIGAAYVPLDPSAPAKRTRWIARDCALRAVVTVPRLLGTWLEAGEHQPHLVLVEHDGATDAVQPAALASHVTRWTEVLATSADALPPRPGSPDELAYILYTSGSTGTPKGVMLSHENALAFVEWAASQAGLARGERVASVAPFHFDLSVFDIWATLSRAGTLIIIDDASVISGNRMLDAIHARGIQVWYSVPSALVLLLAGGLEARGAPSLRVVFFAGEVFPIAALRRVMAALPGARFYNLFGPTETNVCTAYPLEVIPEADLLAIPIGHPACGNTCSVLDDHGSPLPHGEVGELYVDGATVMLGYWQDGSCKPAERPYPTGDLVSQRADGAFMYHGRRDHQLKVHGFRVDPAEVEAALHAHPLIREGLVVVLEQRLVALVVPADSPSAGTLPDGISVMDVRRHCAAHLPRHMLPAEVRFVSDLPRTSTGKLDRLGARDAVARGAWCVLGQPAGAPPRTEVTAPEEART